ncbi:MAG: hypothetical protein K6G63_07395, partial [Eubacterium sp.]|nr:hypothetical protein [Eubacterium sp.]
MKLPKSWDYIPENPVYKNQVYKLDNGQKIIFVEKQEEFKNVDKVCVGFALKEGEKGFFVNELYVPECGPRTNRCDITTGIINISNMCRCVYLYDVKRSVRLDKTILKL